jgi:hypothetical protein
VALLGQTWDRPAEASSPYLRAPPVLPGAISARWLDPAGLAALGLTPGEGEGVWRPALYARMQVAFDGEVRLVHRLRFPADDASPVAIVLEDAWLLRRAPASGRYAPAPAVVPDDQAVVELRDAWTAAVVREETTTRDGKVVYARRSAVEVLGFVVVWVCGAG